MIHHIQRSLTLLALSAAFAMSARAEHSGFYRGYISHDVTPVYNLDRQPAPGSFFHAVDFGAAGANVQYNDANAVAATKSPKSAQRFDLDSALAQAYLVDQVTIEAPGLEGQAGSVVFEFRLAGSISASGGSDPDSNTYAQYQYQISVGPVVTEFGRYVVNTNGTTEGTNVLNQNRQLTTGLNFSAPIRVLWDNTNDTRTSRFVGSAGSVQTQFSMRVVKVLDRDGKEVTNYKVTSHSGAYYGAGDKAFWAAGPDMARNERFDPAGETAAMKCHRAAVELRLPLGGCRERPDPLHSRAALERYHFRADRGFQHSRQRIDGRGKRRQRSGRA